MKKSCLFFFLIIIITVSLGAQIRFGLGGGYAIPSDSHLKEGIGPGLQLGIILSPTFAIEFSWARFLGDIDNLEQGFWAGQLKRMPIELSLQGRMPFDNERIIPFFFFGGGLSFNRFNPAASVTDPWSDVGITVTESAERSITAHAGLGIDLLVSAKLALNINAKFLFSLVTGAWTQTDKGTGLTISGKMDKLKTDALIINVGIKYSF